MHSKK